MARRSFPPIRNSFSIGSSGLLTARCCHSLALPPLVGNRRAPQHASLASGRRWLIELARTGRLAGAAKHGNTGYIPEEEVAGSVGRYTRRLASVLCGLRPQRQTPSSVQYERAAATLLRESSRPRVAPG